MHLQVKWNCHSLTFNEHVDHLTSRKVAWERWKTFFKRSLSYFFNWWDWIVIMIGFLRKLDLVLQSNIWNQIGSQSSVISFFALCKYLSFLSLHFVYFRYSLFTISTTFCQTTPFILTSFLLSSMYLYVFMYNPTSMGCPYPTSFRFFVILCIMLACFLLHSVQVFSEKYKSE